MLSFPFPDPCQRRTRSWVSDQGSWARIETWMFQVPGEREQSGSCRGVRLMLAACCVGNET